MGDSRFPSIKYRNEIASETEEMINSDNLSVTFGGTPEPETDWIYLENNTSDCYLLSLIMNADERYKEKSNYVIYDGEPEESTRIAEYRQINHAKQKWFNLVRQYAPDTDS